MLRQRAKVEWIKLGDSNSAYFHAILKSKHKQTNISMLKDANGNRLITHEKIEEEVLNFYKKLIGEAYPMKQKIDIVVLREGKQVSSNQSRMLIAQVTEEEIY